METLWRTRLIYMQHKWCNSGFLASLGMTNSQSFVIPSEARNLLSAYAVTTAAWYSSYVPLKSVIL